MPGVNVTTAVRTGPVGTGDIVAGQVFLVGETERGPTTAPTLLRSFSDYTTYYGNYDVSSADSTKSNLYAHVKTFFDEGGSRCYVQRVAGAGAAAGNIVLNDSSGSAVLNIDAQSVGAWSDNLDIEVVAGDQAGYFKVKVYLDNALLLTTRDLADLDDAQSVLNTSAVNHLIDVNRDGVSASTNNPDVAAATALSGGSDGSAVDAAGIAAALAEATSPITTTYNTGAVAAPGWTGATVYNALRDHAAAFNRVALLGFDKTTTAADAKTSAATYYSDAHAPHMAFYWPWIKVASPGVSELATGASTVSSSTITISPEAFAAAARSRAVQAVGGPWRAGAGQISAATTIKGLHTDVTAATGDALDEARVNAIRTIGNSIRVYGARSVSNDESNWRYITMRDTINYIIYGVEDRMEQYIFETLDGRGNLFGRIRASIKAFLEPLRVAGGLYEAYADDGALIDPGYNVVVDSSINPTAQLANGLVKAQVGVRVSGVADLIDIVITKSNLSAPVI